MKISYSIGSSTKPKNFSRKGKICSCLCRILNGNTGNNIEKVMVKYEVTPNTNSLSYIRPKKYTWANHQYWGEFKQIIELPKVFSKLEDEDYTIKIGSFSRDNIQMPYVAEILILNVNKYLKIKNAEERRNKLNKIKNI